MLLSLEMPEIPTYLVDFFPSLKDVKKDWFISPVYHMQLVVFWYIKFTLQSLARILLYTAFCKTAVNFSTVIFMASFIILCYQIVDLFLFWFNYNTWTWFYEFSFVLIYVCVRGLVRPYEPDTFARIKSMF